MIAAEKAAPWTAHLADLVRGLPGTILIGPDTAITGIAYDSRKTAPGNLFAAIPGTRTDGAEFIPAALQAGAAALLVARTDRTWPVPVVVAEDVRMTLGNLAARFYSHPDHELTLIGITGTNGKTTVTYLLESILGQAGHRPAVLGTINYRFQDSTWPAATTTPESVDIMSIVSTVRAMGATHAVMEVSSHALDQRRVSGLWMRHALFTNLSRDHLDYHRDMEEYYQAKKKLFTQVITGAWAADRPHRQGSPLAVVNLDHPAGVRLAEELDDLRIPRQGYGVKAPGAGVTAEKVRITEQGIQGVIHSGSIEFELRSRLVGLHNLENILAAAGLALSLGIEPEAIRLGINALDRVPGRLEPIANRAGITVLVDYAHTPDALEHALDTLQALAGLRLITVFGCGGDRDPGKRAQMGRIAVARSHLAIITSDNPRTEDPGAIIAQILEGVKETKAGQATTRDLEAQTRDSSPGNRENVYIVEPDRRKAIKFAIRLAWPGDVVLIAGKGHEDYQIIGSEKIHFDDREEASQALADKERQ